MSDQYIRTVMVWIPLAMSLILFGVHQIMEFIFPIG